jgi:acetylornithine deacetylase/succinyl-diaminopimelate desuccinylase-like protein
MKGQIMASLIAIEAIIHQDNCPVNIKVIFEGEEEIGSPNLNDFLSTHIDLLSGDVSLNPDAGMISEDTPSITYGLRGLAFFELIVEGPDHDLHSGQFGGVINNPAQVLCELIAGMHDSKGRITLPGFYTDVRNVSEDETLELKRIKLTEDQIIDLTGTPSIWGETEYSPIERVTTRPTLEINGLISGYTGHGGKTIIPSTSMAKISFRLVPDQDPDDVHQQLYKYLEDHAPKTVRWYLSPMAGSPPTRINLNTPEIKAMADAMYSVWGKKPVYKREGGSIPVVTSMQKILGIESVLVGFGLPDDSIHSPNESLNLNTWIQGARSLVHFLYNLGSREDKA